MRKITRLVAAALALTTGGAASAKTTVIYAGKLIADADKGAQGPATIVVTDDRITSITAGRAKAPAGAEIVDLGDKTVLPGLRSEEHTSELQSIMRISYAVFCLKKKKNTSKDYD